MLVNYQEICHWMIFLKGSTLIDREDFRGHSLSVSDIVVLNDGEKVTAHFVDSISFEQLDSFLNLKNRSLVNWHMR